MHPSWGAYGGGHQPPHFGPRPHQFRELSLQQLQQQEENMALRLYQRRQIFLVYTTAFTAMQQLQQLHQKQLQSVLHHSGNASSGTGPPSWQTGPNSFPDPSAPRGPQPPPPEVKPPAPEPSSSSLTCSEDPPLQHHHR